jgi:hypothetical protein
MPKYGRIDNNHNEIKNALRDAGFHVADTSRLGAGFPDLMVTGYHNDYQTLMALLVEVKSKGGKLTVPEKRFHKGYPDGGPLIIAYGIEDVLRWFGRLGADN